MNTPVLRLLMFLSLVLTACSTPDKSTLPVFDSTQVQDASNVLFTVSNLKGPEAVRYDESQDVYFISNFNGGGNVLDANGFITKVNADGMLLEMEFMVGSEQHPLHAPRGMFIIGTSLFAADAQGVHEFNTVTGEQINFIDFMSLAPGFLNDISADADGNLYVTDTGKTVVYKVTDNEPTVFIDDLKVYPNGITLNPVTNDFVLGSWRADTLNYSFNTAGEVRLYADLNGGNYDGLEFVGEHLFITSQLDSTIRLYTPGMADKAIIHTPGKPADIGLDTKRYHIAVPYIARNEVDFWKLPLSSN